jgi:hypothetical protein
MARDYRKIIPSERTLNDFSYMQRRRGELIDDLVQTGDDLQQALLVRLSRMVKVDRLVDRQIKPDDYFLHCRDLVKKGWNGERIDTLPDSEEVWHDFGQKLREFSRERPTAAELAYSDFNDIMMNSYEDVSRRWKVLDNERLTEIQRGLSEPIFSTYLHIIAPEMDRDDIEMLVEAYSLPAKRADDIIDFRDDMQFGLINVSESDLRYVKGIEYQDDPMAGVDEDRLQLDPNYISNEIQTIASKFDEADSSELIDVKRRYPELDLILSIVTRICKSWLLEANKVYEYRTEEHQEPTRVR